MAEISNALRGITSGGSQFTEYSIQGYPSLRIIVQETKDPARTFGIYRGRGRTCVMQTIGIEKTRGIAEAFARGYISCIKKKGSL